jgi:DNA-binding transcriptional ArsR family regulator
MPFPVLQRAGRKVCASAVLVSVYLPIVSTHERLLKALADPTRREIFESLRSGPRAVGELAAGLPVSRPAVSQHLKVLKEAGLVKERRRGTRGYYSIDPRGLEPLRSYLESFWDEILKAFEAAAENRMGGRNAE